MTEPNRAERVVFAKLCLQNEYNFEDVIFIDEWTVQYSNHASKIWYKFIANETRLGLVPKYAHEYQLHLLGGISRRGKTQQQQYNKIIFDV